MRRAALALLLACTLAVPAAASASQALEAGISDDRLLLGDPDRAAAAVADWSAAGVDVVRIHARWSAIAPDRDATVPPREFHPADPDEPRYDWAALDRAVRLVRAGGLQVMLAITGPGPVWSSSDPTRHDGRYKPSPSHFRAFATAVATRYGAEVDRYLIWNEPNQPLWLTPYREIASLQTDARGGFAQAVRAPSWARHLRARVVDNAAGVGPVSLPVRPRQERR